MRESKYIKEVETVNGYGDRIVIYYFTTEKKVSAPEGELTKYGVGIVMYTQLPNERTRRERKVVDGIFRLQKEAEAFVDVLYNGRVMPISLEEIVEDCVV